MSRRKGERGQRHIGVAGHEGGDVEALAEQRVGDAVLALHNNAVVAQLALPRAERARLCTALSMPGHCGSHRDRATFGAEFTGSSCANHASSVLRPDHVLRRGSHCAAQHDSCEAIGMLSPLIGVLAHSPQGRR